MVEASDGVDALSAVQTFVPHVLVLDLTMPRMGGLEVCQRLRANGVQPLPGIIVITADGDAAGLPGCADRLLIKPFDPARLLGAVECLAARWVRASESNSLAEHTKAPQGLGNG